MTVPMDFGQKNNRTAGELAEQVHGRKVLAIQIEFDVSGKKTHANRLLDAYRAAVAAATVAVQDVMQEGTIKGLDSRMNYGYRHLEGETVEWDLEAIEIEPDEIEITES